jgi:hypothetical protein
MRFSVLLDTSFFIRLVNIHDPIHLNTLNYFKYFIENDIKLYISTISIAEYCVIGKLEELPFAYLSILPFEFNHALTTSNFASILFKKQKTENLTIQPRIIIPNDSKLFAQSDFEQDIKYFVTSDIKSKNICNLLSNETELKFEIIDLYKDYQFNFS